MKSYPKIPHDIDFGLEYDVFDKLDGSNIRAEWRPKAGFDRFGTRKLMLHDGNLLAPARQLIKEKYEESLSRIFVSEKYQEVTCFFEYVGPNSFAGYHFDAVDRMDVVLFDVSPLRKGMLDPATFLRMFGHLHVPHHLGRRRLDAAFVEAVRSGLLADITFEGVVCKTTLKNRLRMAKIKSRAWLDRLKSECRSEEEFVQRA